MASKKSETQKKKDTIKKNNELVTDYSETVNKMMAKTKEQLPELLSERRAELTKDLVMYGSAESDGKEISLQDHKYPYQEVIDKCFNPIIKYGCKEADYSPQELYEILDIFEKMCSEIKIYEETFTPTLDLFLRFADISTYQFDKLRSSQDYAVVVSKIDVFICSYISDNAMKRLIDSKSAIFAQQADHKKRDRDEPITINATQNVSILSDDERKQIQESLRQYAKNNKV